MTRRWLRGTAALALLALPLLGCEPKKMIVAVEGFGPELEGLWLWRLSEATGQYERTCRLALLDVRPDRQGGERAHYIQECVDGAPGIEIAAPLTRSPDDPTSVTIEIYYARREAGGVYRISSYGPDGESPLSETTVDL